MSRVANDSAWKRRVLKEEAVLENRNLVLARSLLKSNAVPPSSQPLKKKSTVSEGNGPIGRRESHTKSQVPREPLRPPSVSGSAKWNPRMDAAAGAYPDDRSDAQSVSSYSSGTSIQSYPSTRLSIAYFRFPHYILNLDFLRISGRSGSTMRTTSTTLSKIERLERILEEEREKRLVAEREIQLLKDAILSK
mmetsp:Transcript_12545/g.34514  ORF Transcript_12545/g.34514 Transcript_12545/m.34514 type:complete len:192 (+) Transcript_12545:41-616(+)